MRLHSQFLSTFQCRFANVCAFFSDFGGSMCQLQESLCSRKRKRAGYSSMTILKVTASHADRARFFQKNNGISLDFHCHRAILYLSHDDTQSLTGQLIKYALSQKLCVSRISQNLNLLIISSEKATKSQLIQQKLILLKILRFFFFIISFMIFSFLTKRPQNVLRTVLKTKVNIFDFMLFYSLF